MSRRKRTDAEPVKAVKPRARRTAASSVRAASRPKKKPASSGTRPRPVGNKARKKTGVLSHRIIAVAALARAGLSAVWALRPAGVSLLPVLAGLGLGWQWSGLRTILSARLDPAPGTAAMAAAVALLAAGLGPWLPERLLLAVLRAAERWYYPKEEKRAEDAAGFRLLRAFRDREPAMLWMALALLASAAGLLSLLTLALCAPCGRLYEGLLDHFLWTNLTLTLLEWTGTALLTGPAWALNAMLVSGLGAVVALSQGRRRGQPLVSGLLLGLGLAWAVDGGWLAAGLSGPQLYLLGVLPMFALAGVAAWIAQRRAPESAADGPEDLPEVTPRGEGVIWLSFVGWGIATALVLTGWCGIRPAVGGPGGLLLAMGIGGLFRAYWTQRGQYEDRCGSALWAAGACSAAAATLCSYRLAHGAEVQLVALAGPIGYALAEAEAAWLARHGREAFAFGQLIHAALIGLAIGLLAAFALLVPQAGAVGAIALGGLAFIAIAGVLVIREGEHLPERRDYRLIVAIVSLLVAAMVLPGGVRWSRDSVPVAAANAVPEPLDPEIIAAIREGVRGRSNVCVIGVQPVDVPTDAGSSCVDVLDAPLAAGNGRAFRPMTSYRQLQLERRRYHLIYQRTATLSDYGAAVSCSLQWLRLLARHATPGARIVADIPLESATPRAVAVIAATFERAAGPARWRVVHCAKRNYLRMESAGDKTFDKSTTAVKSLTSGADARVHSLACDRLSAALAAGPGDMAAVPNWLALRSSGEMASRGKPPLAPSLPN